MRALSSCFFANANSVSAQEWSCSPPVYSIESDARTHRAPKALSAKSIGDANAVLRQLWERVCVLASLSLLNPAPSATPSGTGPSRTGIFRKSILLRLWRSTYDLDSPPQRFAQATLNRV